MATHLTFDDIKRIAIIAVFSDDLLLEELVLKGGNAIDIAYGHSWRGSVDLDFSMGDDFEPLSDLRARLIRCLETAFLERGLMAFDIKVTEVPPGLSDDIKDFWGGYQVQFKLVPKEVGAEHRTKAETLRRAALRLHSNGSPTFEIDISKHELRDDKIIADLQGYTIPVYSPRMIVCEKLRAVCQQMEEYAPVVHRKGRPGTPRAKDFFDIHVVVQSRGVDFADEPFRQLLRATFAMKRVPLRLIGSIPETREFHRPGFMAVRDTVRPGIEVKEFDFYFDYVVEKCQCLQSLWIE